MRFGNIEYKCCNTNDNLCDEIVCWYENCYYKSEDELRSEGWVFDNNGDAHLNNSHIHHGMFKSKELCYVIAYIEWNNQHDEYDVKSIGRRAFELKDDNKTNFMKLLDRLGENNN